MSITRKIMAATLATSALLGIAFTAQQPTTHVQARRYRYRRVIRRNWNRRCHTGYFRRGVWHRYATGHFSRSWRWIPNRRRTKRYHITLGGYTFNGLTKGIHGIKNGWTTNYRTYRQAENEIKAGVAQESRVDHISRRAAMRNLSNYGIKPRRAKHYHIGIGKYSIGWTTNYKFYKNTMRRLRHAMAIHNRNLAEENANQNKHHHAKRKNNGSYLYLNQNGGSAFNGYIEGLDDSDFHSLPSGNYSGDNVNGDEGTRVRILDKKTLNGETFDKIKNPGTRNDIWVYSGNLSTNPNRFPHFDIDKIIAKAGDTDEDEEQSQENQELATNFDPQTTQQTLKDINKSRAEYGSNPLTETPQLMKLAKIRSQQLLSNFSHYDNNGTPYVEKDAQEAGFPSGEDFAENIAEEPLSNNVVTSYGNYSNRTGADIAYHANDNMVNHDAASDWGHRANILNSGTTEVGIGTSHNNNGDYYIAEDFE